MKTKAIVAGSVVLVFLVFLAMLLVVYRKPPQDITIRHVKSVQSADITTMTFEIKNHTTTPYLCYPNEVQIRNGNAWTEFRDRHIDSFPHTTVGRTGLVYCTVSVTNLPAKSVVRYSIRSQKVLFGLSGLFRRVELNWEHRGGRLGYRVPSLNPYDRNSSVLGKKLTDVTSDEFVEQNGLPK